MFQSHNSEKYPNIEAFFLKKGSIDFTLKKNPRNKEELGMDEM